MTDDWSEQQRAAHAKALLADPMIGAFFLAEREQIFSAWMQTSEDDTGQRERLWHRQQALEAFRAHLQAYIASGELLTHAEQVHE
jgi:hypothetical protein